MSQFKLKPLHDRVIVKPNPMASETTGGLVLAESAKEKPQSGTVVAVGPGKSEGAIMQVKAGDIVYYGKFAGTEMNFEGDVYLMMRESDIIAIM